MSERDGGQAFPVVEPEVEGQQRAYVWSYGMTLRDYFAAQAMAATIARVPMVKDRDPRDVLPQVPMVTPEVGAEIRRAVATLAYEYADAMLAERQK